MKVGDTVYRRHIRWVGNAKVDCLDPITVTALGRKWATTSFGRCLIEPNVRGEHHGEYGLVVFTSKLAAEIADWHRRAAVRCSNAAFQGLTPDQLAQVLAIVAPDFEPPPKETP